ncbi:DUF3084 domain-containing protein [Aerosakkonema funiforme]|uniref:DUF3084 domain-containing protein n=2 Tax=Oscillatoriophycideae TaxID=1301283 RepID=A0A926ZKG0_9CYAN|nr:DUF3084 domain-containing protein [Aerosakkonema funiforme]MBD2185332.1 DUF3084 domain-containing protein [Aerosakkonema funiforme FACHB-1375]
MTTGLILIAAILVLGGAIASVGDRIGTKVGKARLSLFNLRPKNTAVLITFLTGSLISSSTLAILFAASEQLRTGVFKLEKIQKDLRSARQQIEESRTEKSKAESEKVQVEQQLAEAKSEQSTAQKRLDSTNQALQLALAKLAEAMAKQARTEMQLNRTQTQLSRTQTQLSQTENQLGQTENQLGQTQSALNGTQEQLKAVSGQAQELRSEIQKLQAERQDLIAQRNEVKAQITELKQQLDQRDEKIAARDRIIQQKDEKIGAQDDAIAQRDRQIAAQDQRISQKEQEIAARDGQIATRDQTISQQESRLKELKGQLTQQEKLLAQQDTKLSEQDKKLSEREQKLNILQKEVASLEQDYQQLFRGNVTVRRGQVLAAGVVRIVEPSAARQAVDRLLLQANRVALERTHPDNKNLKQQVIVIRQADVNQLIDKIDDGKDYVVRIISSGNYVAGGEYPVQVFVDVSPNRVVFQAGEVVASTYTDSATMTEDQLRERIDLLISASQFRLRRAGIVADRIQIGDDRIETLTRFLEQVKQSKQPLDVRVVAAEPTYTAGPVKMDLIAIQGGQVVFRTQSTS